MRLNPMDEERFGKELTDIFHTIAALGGVPEELALAALQNVGRQVEETENGWAITKPRPTVDTKDIARGWIQKHGQDIDYVDASGLRHFAEREDLTDEECSEIWQLIRDASVRVEFL